MGGVVSANVSILDSDSSESSSDSDDADAGGDAMHGNSLMSIKSKNSKDGKKGHPARRPSILGIDLDQLKVLQNKEKRKEKEADAERLLEDEWGSESDRSLEF